MMTNVFISHNHADKGFARRLAGDLENHGVKCWIDEAEIKIGDSLIQKIREGIDNVNFFAVILSPNSVNSSWVANELDVAMNHQIEGKPIKILPILLKDCDLPSFLVGKFYGDFRDESNYLESFRILTKSIGVVFNRNVMTAKPCPDNLSTAVNKAISINLPIMRAPFHRPFQYMGMPIQKAEQVLEASCNSVGNIILENDECRMVLEAEGNFVNYVEVDIKRTAPHNQNEEFDSEAILGALSISLAELELVRKQTHFHTYYDHRKRLKICVSCSYDGAPILVGFSSKYYGQ